MKPINARLIARYDRELRSPAFFLACDEDRVLDNLYMGRTYEDAMTALREFNARRVSLGFRPVEIQ